MITDEEKMLKERLRHLLADRKTSIRTIADTDSERVMLNRQINGEETIVPYRTLYKILYMFPDVSADWLIMGEGGMLKAEHVAPHIHNIKNEVNGSKAGGDINVGNSTIPYPVRALLDEKDARIAELERINNTLQNVVNAFTAGIKK